MQIRAFMPLLWRYLLKGYFKLFFLSIGAFVSLLLVMRAQEIARFASLKPSILPVLWFTLSQLPYILPFAIPISGLIASTILMQTMSQTHELTALRACGTSLSSLMAPLMLSAIFLSILNFVMISEIGPYCKLEVISLLHRSVQENPLMLFRKNKFLIVKNSVVDMDLLKDGTHAKHFLFAFLDPSSQKLSLISAEHLYLEQGYVKGSALAMISTLESHKDSFDDFLIENQETMSMDANQLTSLLKSSYRRVRYEQLPTKLCLVKMRTESLSHKARQQGLCELYKRAYFTLAPITFIFLGTCFGITLGRKGGYPSVISISLLTIFLFLGYILGKSIHKNPSLALICYLLPHLGVYAFSLYAMKKLQRGIE